VHGRQPSPATFCTWQLPPLSQGEEQGRRRALHACLRAGRRIWSGPGPGNCTARLVPGAALAAALGPRRGSAPRTAARGGAAGRRAAVPLPSQGLVPRTAPADSAGSDGSVGRRSACWLAVIVSPLRSVPMLGAPIAAGRARDARGHVAGRQEPRITAVRTAVLEDRWPRTAPQTALRTREGWAASERHSPPSLHLAFHPSSSVAHPRLRRTPRSDPAGQHAGIVTGTGLQTAALPPPPLISQHFLALRSAPLDPLECLPSSVQIFSGWVSSNSRGVSEELGGPAGMIYWQARWNVGSPGLALHSPTSLRGSPIPFDF